MCKNELISTLKIKTFFPMLPSINKNSERESNPMPQAQHFYLSESAFLISFTKSVFKFLNHGLSV